VFFSLLRRVAETRCRRLPLRPVNFFDGAPVVEIIFEVALFIILELALGNEQLILAFKTARFPALALFRDPEVALKNGSEQEFVEGLD
jgi:hypothetical protein